MGIMLARDSSAYKEYDIIRGKQGAIVLTTGEAGMPRTEYRITTSVGSANPNFRDWLVLVSHAASGGMDEPPMRAAASLTIAVIYGAK